MEFPFKMSRNACDNRSHIKRPQTASPYVMAVKYRNKAKIVSRKTNRATITRRRIGRRRDSSSESIYGCESFKTNTSMTDLLDEFYDDYDYDDSSSNTSSVYRDTPSKQSNQNLEDSFVTTSLESCSPEPARQGIKDETESKTKKDQTSYCENQYKRMCTRLNIIPVQSFMRELSTRRVSVRHRSLCSNGAKAIAVALLENPTVQILDMSDNEIGPTGASYIAEMLTDNRIITDLNLSDNQIGIEGAKHIVAIAIDVDNFTSLNLSGNGLREFDAIHLRKLVEDTHNLLRLNLSHNEFREFGGKVIGDALKINDTIEELDLSWNHLRYEGAKGIANGLELNQGLKKLDISWNGFSIRGCEALSSALQVNDTLFELNLECNRINKEALEKLFKGMKTNSTLHILKLGWNPISAAGAQLILDFINSNRTTGLKIVDIRTQLVELPFATSAKELNHDRDILIIHGAIRGLQTQVGEDLDELSLVDENPIIVLMEFGHMNGYRLTDLFSVFDKDGSRSLDKLEIKTGLKMAGIPLNDRCLDILIDKLDDDGSGEIEFSEMMQAQMIHKRQKAKMMMEVATAHTEVEKTDVGRVRSKLNKLMAKHMEGNPAFKRRVDDFKQLMNSSKRDDVLRAAFEKKLAIRKELKIERAKALEIRRAKEEAIALIVEADNQEIEAKLLDIENTNNSALEQETLSENIPNKTPDSKGGTPVWKALHV